MHATSTVLCAWCGTQLATSPMVDEAAPVWFGICQTCSTKHGNVFPVQNLHSLNQAEYDALPVGALLLDDEATVLAYNSAEEALTGLKREAVIGRNFFTDIAPCTRVQSFEGTFQDMVKHHETARTAFDFVFRFAGGDRFVHIAIAYVAEQRRAVILVDAVEPNT